MTWNEMEEFAQICLDKKMQEAELKDLAKRMLHFDSINFINILSKRGINISI